MDESDRTIHEAALKRAHELLSRDLETWRPAFYKRVRWWNLALGGVIVAAVASVIVPLKRPAYREGFSGNLVSSAWQLIVGGAVAWIVLKRFKAERFEKVMPISWDESLQEMTRISLSLYPMAIGEAADLRTALNTELRKKLSEALTRTHRKGTLYGRFFEIEQIVDLDRSCDAAEDLAGIDDQLPDPKFMKNAIDAICELYVWSSRFRGLSPSPRIIDTLHGARKKWSTLA